MNAREAVDKLMDMHRQFVCPKDTVFIGIAELIQSQANTIKDMERKQAHGCTGFLCSCDELERSH